MTQIEDPLAYTEVPAGQLASALLGGFVVIVDSGALPAHEYAYRIVAENSNKLNSGFTAFLDATTGFASAKAPLLGQPIASANGIGIPVTSDMGLIALERSQGANGAWIQIGTSASGTTTLADPGPVKGQTYNYRARLIDAYGNVSVYSGIVTIPYNPS
jgi:hypothetical protein